MLSNDARIGCSADHVQQVAGEAEGVMLQAKVSASYARMRAAIRADGLDIAIASGFRDFARQLTIWQQKCEGKRPLYDIQGQLVDPTQLTVGEKLECILTWSALPGLSRHHWGTDFDVYDPTAYRNNTQLRLELTPSEYQGDGPSAKLALWLQQHAEQFGFFLPYREYQGGVAAEPWHLSHLQYATEELKGFDLAALRARLAQIEIAHQDYILNQLEEIKARYADTICPPRQQGHQEWFG